MLDSCPKILLGDFNCDIHNLVGDFQIQLCNHFTNLSLGSLHEHFHQWKKSGLWTWRMQQYGKILCFQLDYILVEDKRFFC